MESNDNEDLSNTTRKKKKLISIKEFRSKLTTTENLLALQEFLSLCKNTEDQDYVFEYLENGGTCLELYQLLETTSNLPATLILETVHQILLGIVSQYPQFYTPAYEACRYFLNTHIALINKMLSLSATSHERKVVLKLLTAFITLSRHLAKDILINVNFNPTNLEVLTKQVNEKDSVRNALIHFIVAYLVEDHYPTIALLLEKKIVLTSIIHGLQNDSAETVCMVMLSFKNNILENKRVSKTTKMNVFSTPVVKDIVNLYNWKGPKSFISKKKVQNVVVDELEKSRVSESVHSFLLVLCTSHAFGVIFKDRQLGLGKTHNSLMLTVLESLEKPWEHSYASDLVTKISAACPDLAKVLWSNLKQFLEPRDTGQWYKAITFATQLTKKLKPSSIEFAVHDISISQLAHVILSLVAPSFVLKIIVPENFTFEKPELKQQVLSALLEIYRALENYLTATCAWLKPQDYRTLKNLINEHVLRTFPKALDLLQNWSESDIEIIFELLDLYENSNPLLLESLGTINLMTFLDKIRELPNLDNSAFLQIRAIKVFLNFEPGLFLPQNKFGLVFPLILTFYYETKNENGFETLKLLFKNTGIFEGCLDEIDVWVNSVFDLQSLETDTCTTIVEAIKNTFDNIFDYINKMSELCREHADLNDIQDNFEDILEMLSTDAQEESTVLIKRHGLSPLTLGCLDYLSKIEQSRNFKNYFSIVLINLLHTQPTPLLLNKVVLMYKHILSDFLVKYVTEAPVALRKSKTPYAQNFSLAFFDGSIENFLVQNCDDMKQYPGQLEFCLNQALFYFTNLDLDCLTDVHASNCLEVVKFVLQNNANDVNIFTKIFTHPVLLQRFSPGHIGISMNFLLKIVKEFNVLETNIDLKPFRSKLVGYLKNVIKKRGKKVKYYKVLEILEVFKLETHGCSDILTVFADWQATNTDLDFLNFIYSIVVFCLCRVNDLALENDIIEASVSFLTF